MLKIPTRVVWSNEDEQLGPMGMGLRFEGVGGWQLKRMAAELIRRAGLQSVQTLLKGSES